MSSGPEHQAPLKNVFKGTTNRPLRFAVLGPHRSSKSSFVSIISNQISLPNHYPTVQNSPVLVQFQPKRFSSRAILDVRVTPKDLEEVGLLGDSSIVMDQHLMKRIDMEGLRQAKERASANTSDTSEDILAQTNRNYDLDYTVWDMFDNEYFKPINSFASQVPAVARLDATVVKGRRGVAPLPVHFDLRSKSSYKPPVSTPILIELIDTPGVQEEDLIPFLERSLDCRLSKDVLNNLANDYNTNFRSRVKPLITASGISDLNAGINGYLLCYSAVPEVEDTNVPPPIYGDATVASEATSQAGPFPNSTCDVPSPVRRSNGIDVLRSLYYSIVEAWQEWTTYHVNWEIGKEYDSLSLATSIKQIWKRKELPLSEIKDPNELSGEDRRRLEKFLEKSDVAKRPPIVVACTHVDSPYASPLLQKKGRELASEWGCAYVEMSCSYEARSWKNVEEALALLVREASDVGIKRQT